MGPGGRRTALQAGVALVAFIPFVRGVLAGESLFFRDLAGQFLPLRAFIVEGLRQGQLRYWNPLVHEGEPLALAPLGYPLDLLQALLPGSFGVSLSLVLHVPLAAVCFMALARRLGARDWTAAGGAFVYALGGFSLSSLNLYVYAPAIAWAPLVSLGLLRASEGSRRDVAAAAGLVALALSTTGVEIVAQSVLLGAVLPSAGRRASGWARLAAALTLGACVAAVPLLHTGGLIEGSARARGFETDVVLAHSVHPLTALQALIAGFYGDTSDLATRWWGQNFFPTGFPYLLSLYVGSAALALAFVGATAAPPRLRRRLLGLAALGALVCLGRYAGLAGAVDAMPWLRLFRYPSKAFFLVHATLALLAALGLEALRTGVVPAWRRLAFSAAALGLPLAVAPGLPFVLRGATTWFVSGFFPPEYPWSLRLECLKDLLADAAAGGLVALALAGLATLVLAGRLAPRAAAGLLAALLAADLLRAGAGLNPTVATSFFSLSPEMARWAERLRAERARVFSCEPEFQAAFQQARRTLARGQDVWTFAALAEAFVPFHNMNAGVATALSRDRNMLVPEERTFSARQVACNDVESLVDSLRRTGVSYVLSVAPLAAESLRLLDVVAPRSVPPLRLHVYALSRPLPLRAVARTVQPVARRAEAEALARTPGFQESGGVAVEGAVAPTRGGGGRVFTIMEAPERLEFRVEAERPSVVVVRDAYAPGWHARVDDRQAPVWRADGRHRAVMVPRGTSRLVLEYRPPRQALGIGLSLAGLATLAVLALGGRRRTPSG